MTARGQSTRTWLFGGVVAALVLAALAWFLVISPVRADAQTLRDNAAAVDSQNAVLEAKVSKLQEQAKHKPQLVADLTKALDGLPPGTQLPVFSRQLAAQAAGRGIALTSVAIASPTTPGSTASPATGATALAVPITVQSTGAVLQQLFFLKDIQQLGPRLVLVKSVSFASASVDTKDGTGGSPAATDASNIDTNSTMTLQLTVFTNPLPKASRDQLAKVLGDDTL